MISLCAGIALAAMVAPQVKLSDPDATKQTKALYANLKKLAKKGVSFGHQHATEYGHGWFGDEDRSDVKSIVGSHPAVIGIDFMGLSGRPDSEISKEKVRLKKVIEDHYNRGGVITIAWHINNPVAGGGFNATRGMPKSVKEILPGGTHHAAFQKILRDVADVAKSCVGKDGNPVPMIFRPWHEFDGNWFWWGAAHCTVEEFKSLYKLTVTELRDTNQVHNFIYAFSPDCTWDTEEKFLTRYPGDEWVDMVGFDDYADFGRDRYNLERGAKLLTIVSDFAKKTGKVAAFTETGLESIPNHTWWTETLLKTLKTPGLEISYALVWRNDINSPTHYYAPFPGHTSVPDFQRFYDDPFTIFLDDLKNPYK